MRLTDVTYVCDICGQEITYNAFNKRAGLVVRDRGLVLQEDNIGHVCNRCRRLAKPILASFIDAVREKSWLIEEEWEDDVIEEVEEEPEDENQ